MTPRRTAALAHGVTRLARDLTGQSSKELTALVAEQSACTERGARLVEQLASGQLASGEARATMRRLEHAGDAVRAKLVGLLGTVLATPIDAEDLFRLSRSIDDVLDNLRDFVREVDLYHPASLELESPLARALAVGADRLHQTVDQLGNPRDGTRRTTLATRKAAGRARRLYQQQLATLFDQPVDRETLKHRELLRRLDVVGLRLGEAADALADGLLKRNR